MITKSIAIAEQWAAWVEARIASGDYASDSEALDSEAPDSEIVREAGREKQQRMAELILPI